MQAICLPTAVLRTSLPSWCASEPDCRERQTGGYRIQGDPLVATSGGVSL